jgi:hypothetical protein
LLGDLRTNLQGSLAAAASPYGYTLVIWSSGAVAMDVLGSPAPWEVLLFLAGASLGFLGVALAVFGRFVVELETPPSKRLSLLGITHVLSVGLAVVLVWGAVSLIDGPAGWPVAGALATVVYLAVGAVQVTIASPHDG